MVGIEGKGHAMRMQTTSKVIGNVSLDALACLTPLPPSYAHLIEEVSVKDCDVGPSQDEHRQHHSTEDLSFENQNPQSQEAIFW